METSKESVLSEAEEPAAPHKTKKAFEEKVSLTKDSSVKLESWISFLEEKKKGTKVSKKDLVNWCIKQLSDLPSKAETSSLLDIFYDEERYLRVLLKEARNKKASQVLQQLGTSDTSP